MLAGSSEEFTEATVANFCELVFWLVLLFMIMHHRAMQLRHSLYIIVNSPGKKKKYRSKTLRLPTVHSRMSCCSACV